MPRMPATFVALAIVLVAASQTTAQQRLADFRRIVIDDVPLPVQKAAADELCHYVGKILGKPIEVVTASKFDAAGGLSFFIGDTTALKLLQVDLAPWKPEEWLLRSVPQGLILAGDDRAGDPWSAGTYAGSMLATYTLLDDYLGVRWFWPGPFGEHVPIAPDAVIPVIDQRSAPAFRIRSISTGYSAYHTDTFRKATRQWYRRTRQGWTQSAVFGHSWNDAFHLRTGEDFKQHPEWFALVKGKRQPPQMCTTNPDVIDRMVQRVLAGKTDIVNISPSDGRGFCECDEQTKSQTHKRLGLPSCTALDVPGLIAYDGKSPQLSDRIFTYANEVARRVREKDPSKSCGMFAYTFYNKPPVHIKTLEPNLYISFVYQAAAMRDPEAYKQWKESVAGWKDLGGKLVVREGWGNHYYLDLPFIQDEQVLANLREARQLGFVSAYGDGGKSFATQAANTWAVVRMMWDPERDTSRVMDDFYESAYGPAAAEMRAFFATYRTSLDQNWAKRRRAVDTPLIAYANMISSWHVLIPMAVVDEADAHLAAAERLVTPGSEYGERVAFHKFGQRYTRVMLELLDDYRQLTDGGIRLGFAGAEQDAKLNAADRERLLRRAYELGEEREQILLAHRDWAAVDEGMLAFSNDRNLRDWHGAVKRALKIDRPSAVTGKTLAETRK